MVGHDGMDRINMSFEERGPYLTRSISEISLVVTHFGFDFPCPRGALSTTYPSLGLFCLPMHQNLRQIDYLNS